MRCPAGHPVKPIAGTSFKKQVVKFAVLAAGIPLFGIIAFSKVVVYSPYGKFSPFVGWSIIAVVAVLIPLIFVVLGIISLARWSKWRQAIDTPTAEYSKEQRAQGIGLLAGTALIVLTVLIPVVLK